MFCSFLHRHGDVSRKPETLSARYQTAWNVTKCHACHAKRNDNLLGNLRKREVFAASPIDTATPQENQRLEDKTRGCRKLSISYDTSSNFYIFRHVIKQVGMSQNATPATQNDMTTCLETFEKERFCGFPHRHGDATGKPETRDETRGSTKTIIWCDTSGNFHNWQHDKRTGFAASPIDTAKPRENQRLETRHVGAPTRAFCTRLPPLLTLCSIKIDVFPTSFLRNLKFCYLKIDVSCEASLNFQHMSQNATPAREFAPCRHLKQPCQCDLQKHVTRHV